MFFVATPPISEKQLVVIALIWHLLAITTMSPRDQKKTINLEITTQKHLALPCDPGPAVHKGSISLKLISYFSSRVTSTL